MLDNEVVKEYWKARRTWLTPRQDQTTENASLVAGIYEDDLNGATPPVLVPV